MRNTAIKEYMIANVLKDFVNNRENKANIAKSFIARKMSLTSKVFSLLTRVLVYLVDFAELICIDKVKTFLLVYIVSKNPSNHNNFL